MGTHQNAPQYGGVFRRAHDFLNIKRCIVKKNISAIALAVAGFAAQDAFATIAASSVTAGTQIQIGCTLPGPTGATVYSIDAVAFNGSTFVSDTIALPNGVSAGASCGLALNQLNGATGVTGPSTGKWVAQGSTNTNVGVSPINATNQTSGYSLVAYTFVAQ